MTRFSYGEEGGRRWIKGLRDAEAKGRAAAEDPAFNSSHNPYRRYEHRRCWREGFCAERARLIAEHPDFQRAVKELVADELR